MSEEKAKFEVMHHVATGPFSFMEVKAVDTMEKLVAQAKWLTAQFKDIQK